MDVKTILHHGKLSPEIRLVLPTNSILLIYKWYNYYVMANAFLLFRGCHI